MAHFLKSVMGPLLSHFCFVVIRYMKILHFSNDYNACVWELDDVAAKLLHTVGVYSGCNFGRKTFFMHINERHVDKMFHGLCISAQPFQLFLIFYWNNSSRKQTHRERKATEPLQTQFQPPVYTVRAGIYVDFIHIVIHRAYGIHSSSIPKHSNHLLGALPFGTVSQQPSERSVVLYAITENCIKRQCGNILLCGSAFGNYK